MTENASGTADKRVKAWNHLLSSTALFQIESVRIIESDVFEPQIISFPRAVAIVGLHGTGKTLLLRMIEAAFGYVYQSQGLPPVFRNYPPPPQGMREPIPINGIVEVNIKTPTGPASRVVDLSEPPAERREVWGKELYDLYSVWYLGALEAFTDLAYTFQEYQTAVEQERTSWELTASDLNAARNILGRSYGRLSLDTAEIDDAEMPYFHGLYRSREIDISSMSNGELWVHYVNWWLHSIDKGNLTLIDEPETFLAARGRRPLIDQIAQHALRNEMQLMVATHSPEVLARFPIDKIRVCVMGENGIRVITPTSLAQIQDIVGMNSPVRALALVEDRLAEQLLQAIFARYDVTLTREVEIISVGGSEEVIAGLRILRNSKQLTVIGVLDGDQEGKWISRVAPHNGLLLYLPGHGNPEQELISAARREASWIAGIVGRTVSDVEMAINSCYDLDHQYQLSYLASQLGQPEAALIFVLTQAWLRDTQVSNHAENLARDVRTSMQSRGHMDSA